MLHCANWEIVTVVAEGYPASIFMSSIPLFSAAGPSRWRQVDFPKHRHLFNS